MTFDERTAKLLEAKEIAEKLAHEWTQAYLAKETDKLFDLEEGIAKAVKDCNGYAEANCLEECMNAEDPMKEAILRLNYVGIKAKFSTIDREADVRACEIDDSVFPIDLQKLHKTVPGGIGANKSWIGFVEKMNFHMTYRLAKEIGANPKEVSDTFLMHKIANEAEFSGKDPASNTQMQKTLDTVISAMIGDEYHCIKKDVIFLDKGFAKKSRQALKLQCSNHKAMIRACAEICNRIMTNGKYDIEYKKVKK